MIIRKPRKDKHKIQTEVLPCEEEYGQGRHQELQHKLGVGHTVCSHHYFSCFV